jgi:hypothetical protein
MQQYKTLPQQISHSFHFGLKQILQPNRLPNTSQQANDVGSTLLQRQKLTLNQRPFLVGFESFFYIRISTLDQRQDFYVGSTSAFQQWCTIKRLKIDTNSVNNLLDSSMMQTRAWRDRCSTKDQAKIECV